MTTLAVIPARLGALRLPRKPLRDLAGRSIVLRVWDRVRTLKGIDRCLIATDSDEVLAAARAAGAECVHTSAAHQTGTDRVAEVAARRDFAAFDVIVNVQGDEPFIPASAVRGAAALVAAGRFPPAPAAAAAAPSVLDTDSIVKVVTADDGRAMYFSRASIPYLRDASDAGDRAARDLRVRQHIGVYAYTRDALARWVALPTHPLERIERLEQLRPLGAGMAMGVADVAEPAVAGIDTEEDLLRANALWKDFSRKEAAS